MRFEHWLNGMRGTLRRRQRRDVSKVAGLERLEPRIALGDVAFAALGLSGPPDLLAPPNVGEGHAE